MDDVRYVGYMKFADQAAVLRDQQWMATVAMRDTLVSFGVTWEGRMTCEEVESMYLGLLVSFGDDLCE